MTDQGEREAAFLTWQLRMQAKRSEYAQPVICELCRTNQHRRCVKPCICTHGLVGGG